MSIAEFLQSVDGFTGIEAVEMANIARSARVKSYGHGDHLMRRGDPGDTMHILQDGRVRVLLLDDAGREKSVVYLGPGEVIGEMALLTGEPRVADVVADGPVTSVVFQRDIIQPLLEEYPVLAGFLTEILGQRLESRGGIEKVGKYRLLGKLGEGSTGKVYEALHPELNRVVAIKMLAHSLVYDPQFRDRFLEEARTVAGFTHPNIVQVFDTESAYATVFIVMEKLSGHDLSWLMRKEGKLEPHRAAAILRQVGSALAYAHARGFAHRDVKPANVAIDDNRVAKLMDFGLARPIPEDAEGKRSNTVDGTPQYIAPETALGHSGDGRADIYALGVMAFEMLAGRLPFKADTVRAMLRAHVYEQPADIRKLVPDVPERLAEFIQGALHKKPDKRLADWDRILMLLDMEGEAPAVWSNAQEQILRIRYQPTMSERVGKAMEKLVADLHPLVGVEVATGHVTPAGDYGRGGEQE